MSTVMAFKPDVQSSSSSATTDSSQSSLSLSSPMMMMANKFLPIKPEDQLAIIGCVRKSIADRFAINCPFDVIVDNDMVIVRTDDDNNNDNNKTTDRSTIGVQTNDTTQVMMDQLIPPPQQPMIGIINWTDNNKLFIDFDNHRLIIGVQTNDTVMDELVPPKQPKIEFIDLSADSDSDDNDDVSPIDLSIKSVDNVVITDTSNECPIDTNVSVDTIDQPIDDQIDNCLPLDLTVKCVTNATIDNHMDISSAIDIVYNPINSIVDTFANHLPLKKRYRLVLKSPERQSQSTQPSDDMLSESMDIEEVSSDTTDDSGVDNDNESMDGQSSPDTTGGSQPIVDKNVSQSAVTSDLSIDSRFMAINLDNSTDDDNDDDNDSTDQIDAFEQLDVSLTPSRRVHFAEPVAKIRHFDDSYDNVYEDEEEEEEEEEDNRMVLRNNKKLLPPPLPSPPPSRFLANDRLRLVRRENFTELVAKINHFIADNNNNNVDNNCCMILRNKKKLAPLPPTPPPSPTLMVSDVSCEQQSSDPSLSCLPLKRVKQLPKRYTDENFEFH
ncbi:uncharacterized protein LOC128957044 [Oppia nitens]|uniref:uncharacterized protein LOC128957044 n=1 Tax=Oppia nitens TaxID=1686743 RepID=UPI0023DB02A8|nr:uncharacterized protein LOC128957044 [Oppia nitens]